MMKKAIFFVFIINVFSYCAVIHSRDTMQLSSTLSFKSGSVVKDSFGYDVNMLDCGDSGYKKYSFYKDLFFYGEKVYTCVCFTDIFAIGSCVPFYASKVSIDSINFSKELDLNDKDIFNKIDTIRIDSLRDEVRTQCARPHIHAGATDSMDFPRFLVINTNSGYVLITYQDLWNSFQDPELGTIKFYNEILLDSYLQNDKSLNFSEISNLLQIKRIVKHGINNRPAVVTHKTKYYDLQGSVISNPFKNNGIIISNNNPLLIIH